MADTPDIGSPSKYKVALDMAVTILLTLEKKQWGQISRKDYLQAVYESIRVLNGIEPD